MTCANTTIELLFSMSEMQLIMHASSTV